MCPVVILEILPREPGRDMTPRWHTVLYSDITSSQLQRAEPRWKIGTWHGIQEPRESSTHSVITKHGLALTKHNINTRALSVWVEPSTEDSLEIDFVSQNYENHCTIR